MNNPGSKRTRGRVFDAAKVGARQVRQNDPRPRGMVYHYCTKESQKRKMLGSFSRTLFPHHLSPVVLPQNPPVTRASDR